jgi:hypothetical protein
MNLRTSRRAALTMAAGLIASGISAGIAVAPAAQAGTTTKWGCPGGAVCLYTTDGWWDDRPQNIYYPYGNHAPMNGFGQRVIFNNANTNVCLSKTPRSCDIEIPPDEFRFVNITLFNYIRFTTTSGG